MSIVTDYFKTNKSSLLAQSASSIWKINDTATGLAIKLLDIQLPENTICTLLSTIDNGNNIYSICHD